MKRKALSTIIAVIMMLPLFAVFPPPAVDADTGDPVRDDTHDIKVESNVPTAFINLTIETITVPEGIVSFSVDGGDTWKPVKDALSDAKFPKLLNKEPTLHLSDKAIDRETKKPPDDGIIKFPKLNARPAKNPDKLKPYYSSDTWVLAKKDGTKGITVKYTDYQYAPSTDGKKPSEDAVWEDVPEDGIEIKPYGRTKYTYVFRIPPKDKTPASAVLRIRPAKYGKAPKYEFKLTKDPNNSKAPKILTVTVKKGDQYTYGREDYDPVLTAKKALKKSDVENKGLDIRIRKGATGKKPPTEPKIIKLSDDAGLPLKNGILIPRPVRDVDVWLGGGDLLQPDDTVDYTVEDWKWVGADNSTSITKYPIKAASPFTEPFSIKIELQAKSDYKFDGLEGLAPDEFEKILLADGIFEGCKGITGGVTKTGPDDDAVYTLNLTVSYEDVRTPIKDLSDLTITNTRPTASGGSNFALYFQGPTNDIPFKLENANADAWLQGTHFLTNGEVYATLRLIANDSYKFVEDNVYLLESANGSINGYTMEGIVTNAGARLTLTITYFIH